MSFKKAVRQNTKIKLAITGASGSGKTFSALRLASGLIENGRIALIDTENNSASLYAEHFDFDVSPIEPPFTNDKFVQAIEEAVKLGYEVIILDSASHFWEGILEFKDMLDKRGGNSFANWGEAGKRYKTILNALLQSNIHLIACLRSKTEYVLEQNEKGKQVPRKIGLAPIMRDGVEYEFSVVFNLDAGHNALADKDRTGLFTDKLFQINEDTGKTISDWLNGGVDPIQGLRDELEALGSEMYGESWGNKRVELIRHITAGSHEDASKLSENQVQRLLAGMQKLMSPEPELDGIG